MPTQLPPEVEEWIYTHRTPTSALLASTVATFIGFPLDSVKSRLQVSRYNGFLDCVRKTYKHEGVQGFFRGLTMPLLTITLVRTVSFGIYDTTKRKLAKPGSPILDANTLTGRAVLGFLGGATSGLLLSTGTCAFELVKVRSQLEYIISKRRGVPYQPTGTFSGASLIWKENGLRGLYFGYSLHTLRDTLGTSFYFMLYDSTRYLIADPRYGSYVPNTLAPFLCGSACGILSWFLVYPIDLVKTRVQRDALSGVEDRESASEIFRRLRQKGIARLYRGLGVSATRSAITHGILWLLLESFTTRIEKRYKALTSIEEEKLVYLPTRFKLDYLRSYVSSAAQAVLAKGNSVPGLPGYQLGERQHGYEGQSIWSLHEGLKRDDNSPVSVFVFDPSPQASPGGRDRRSLLPLARNALKKLRSLRHPDVLRFMDGSESDNAVYIVTEPVEPLTARIGTEGQQPGQGDEWKVWGLSRVVTALKFINSSGASTHGNLRPSSIFTSPSGEWRLGGFEVLSTMKDSMPVLYSQGGLLPDSGRFSSPEVRKSGWDVLKDLDPSALDSYQLYLLIYILFNGPLPSSFISDPSPSLPTTRGSIPAAIFPSHRRLGNPNPRARLKVEAFWELGMGSEVGGGQQGAGFFKGNRLVKLAEGLESFALASEGDRAVLIRTIKDSSEGLPPEFVKYKVLPSLVKAFEFGPGGPALLPLILSLGTSLPPSEYSSSIVQPLVRMFATPDRAMRMALLDGLPQYAEKLESKIVVDKIWPNLITGFSDVVPVIREATVKSVLLLAPKLNDRILNNDLLRYLAKTQTDSEAGIRTNTCILLGRLSKHLQPSTARKVLIPAFARAVRDPFVHARIAGLMSLMATVDLYEKEDLATKVIPSMSICLVDKEKIVRSQAFKALDMFIRKTEQLVASMPDSALSPEEQSTGGVPGQAGGTVAVNKGQPGIAESAGGAAVALAGWAFTSISSRIGAADLQTPMLDRRPSTQSVNGTAEAPVHPPRNGAATLAVNSSPLRSSSQPNLQRAAVGLPGSFDGGRRGTEASSARSSLSIPGTFGDDLNAGTGDWGGDLMDVAADDGDFDEFESAQAAPPLPAEPVVHPRFTITKKATPVNTKPKSTSTGKAGGMRLGSSSLGSKSSLSSSVLKAIEVEEAAAGGAGDWGFDGDDGFGGQEEAGEGWGGEVDQEESSATPTTVNAETFSPPASPAKPAAASSSSTTTSVGKEKLAQMREERKARLAAAREKKANALGAKKL